MNSDLKSSEIIFNLKEYLYRNDVCVSIEQNDRFTDVLISNFHGDKFTIWQEKKTIKVLNSFTGIDIEMEFIVKNICKVDIFEFRKLMTAYRDEFSLFNYCGDEDIAFFENKKKMYWTYKGIWMDQIDKDVFYSQEKYYIFDKLIGKFQFISQLDHFKYICFENKIKKENVLCSYNHFRKFLNSRSAWQSSHVIKEKWLKSNLHFNVDE